MDPDTARTRIIELANKVLANDSLDQLGAECVELAEAVHDLDEWLRCGGFFPAVWTPPNSRRANYGRRKDVLR